AERGGGAQLPTRQNPRGAAARRTVPRLRDHVAHRASMQLAYALAAAPRRGGRAVRVLRARHRAVRAVGVERKAQMRGALRVVAASAATANATRTTSANGPRRRRTTTSEPSASRMPSPSLLFFAVAARSRVTPV